MATDKIETENKYEELNHLGFVRIAAINALLCLSNLYEYVKQNAGPLKSGVQTVEGAVTTIIGPVCEKLKDVPSHLLVFLDYKVDNAANLFEERAPPLAKQIANHVWCAAQKTSQLIQKLVSEAQIGGPSAAVNYAATKYKGFLLDQATKNWYRLNQVPPFHMVAEMAIPTVAHWSEKYNQIVTALASKGYTAFSYVPLVPIEEITKVFKQAEAVKEGVEPRSDGADADGSDSD